MFVTFEGPEGAGKSTAIALVAEELRSREFEVVSTREPGSGPVGAQIRQVLLHGENLDPKAELFLFLADRAQHVAAEIGPALGEGKVVLCDRYGDSTVVYQGVARGLDPAKTKELNAWATGGLVPDLTFLFDIDPTIGLRRLVDRDRLDLEPLEFHAKVRQGFLDLAGQEPQRWVVVDAARPIDDVVAHCLETLVKRLNPS